MGDDGGGINFIVDDLFIKGRNVGSGMCLAHFQRNVPREECSEGEHVIKSSVYACQLDGSAFTDRFGRNLDRADRSALQF